MTHILLFDIPAVILSLKSLKLIKWRDQDNSNVKSFSLESKVSSVWDEMGILLGIEPDILSGWKQECQGKADSCWNKVMAYWIHNGSDYYPATWDGLFVLLRDSKRSTIAEELKRVVYGKYKIIAR